CTTCPSRILSTTRSVTSAPRFVSPQAIDWLWPMTMPGSPEKEKPVTSNGHSSVTFLQRSPTWYQTEGIVGDRCGSLARSGEPVFVCSPEMTHEFEPISSLLIPSRSGSEATLV